jgi:cytochrome c oxidase assembly protein subunit 15
VALFNTPEQRLAGFRLALFGFVLTIAVIGLGAFTRLVHAGLGCPDWPTCYGHYWVPNEAHEIETANANFAETPVETDKTWPEQIHRIFASSLGLIIIALVVVAIKNRGAGQPLKLPLFMLAFVILQGLFGMWTVTLKLWPQVVTAHLLGGFTMACLLWLLILRLNNLHWQVSASVLEKIVALRHWAIIGLLLVVGQISLGGWTTSNYAALACAELPTCHNSEWWPQMDFAQGFNLTQEIGPNYLGGQMDNPSRTAIHMSHRIGAIVTAMYLIGLMAVLRRIGSESIRRMSVIVLSVLAVQILLGLSNIIFSFPVAVAVAHNIFGVLLLLVMVTLSHRLYTAKVSEKSSGKNSD